MQATFSGFKLKNLSSTKKKMYEIVLKYEKKKNINNILIDYFIRM